MQDIPSQERLVSLFLEGIISKSLHASLYTQKLDNLDTCIKVAIDLDDNCNIYQEKTLESGASSQSTRSVANDVVPRVENSPLNMMPKTQELANEEVKKFNYAQQTLIKNDPM